MTTATMTQCYNRVISNLRAFDCDAKSHEIPNFNAMSIILPIILFASMKVHTPKEKREVLNDE